MGALQIIGDNVPSFLKKQYCSVPVWGWGAIITGVAVGGYYIYKSLNKPSYGYRYGH